MNKRKLAKKEIKPFYDNYEGKKMKKPDKKD